MLICATWKKRWRPQLRRRRRGGCLCGRRDNSGLDFDSRPIRRNLTSMIAVVSKRGQIVLPAEIRKEVSIEPGQEFEIERISRGEYRLVCRQSQRNEGLVDWLLG